MSLYYSPKPEMLYDCSSNTVWISIRLYFLLKAPNSQTCATTFTLTRRVDGSNKKPHSNETPKHIQPFLPDAFMKWPCLFLCLISLSLSLAQYLQTPPFLSVEAQIPSDLRAAALTALPTSNTSSHIFCWSPDHAHSAHTVPLGEAFLDYPKWRSQLSLAQLSLYCQTAFYSYHLPLS